MFRQSPRTQKVPDHSEAVPRSRIERVVFGSHRQANQSDSVESARQLLSETIAIVSAIETRIEKLLAIVERAGGHLDPDRCADHSREFEFICTQIDELAALCSGQGSLIDSSAFALSIDVGVHGGSKITIPHVNLTSGPQGLALRGEGGEVLLQRRAHDAALAAVQSAFQTLQRVQRTYRSTSRWLGAA